MLPAEIQNASAVLIHRSEQHRIVLAVIALHCVLVAVLLISGLVQFRPLPKLEVVKVNLVSLPPSTPKPPSPPQVTPPRPDPPKVTPPRQDPPPPVAKPPKKPPPRPPRDKKPSAKKIPVRKAPTAKPKPKKSEWVARKPEEIRGTAKLNRPRRPTPTRPVASVSAADLERKLNAGVRGLRISAPTAQHTTASSADINQYYEVVGAMLKSMWNQPTRSEVGGSPTVKVSVTVLADGRVSATRMLRSSPSRAMNVSVTRVLKILTALPAPSDYGIRNASIPIQIVFELDG